MATRDSWEWWCKTLATDLDVREFLERLRKELGGDSDHFSKIVWLPGDSYGGLPKFKVFFQAPRTFSGLGL